MKEYKSNEELLNHLISKGVKVKYQESALKKIERILETRKYDWLVINGSLEETIEKVELILNFMRKRRFGDISNDEIKFYKKELGGLVFLNAQNIEFLTNFYNRDKEKMEI